MAILAGSRELCRDVVHRAERSVVVVLVAADAGGAGDVVVVVDVAVGTQPGRHGVRAGQNESRSRVIEFPVCP